MTDFGITDPDEVWLVDKALYGFQSSPAHWAVFRDRTMRRFEWKGTYHPDGQSREYKLEQTPEGNLWRILCRKTNSSGEDGKYQQVGLIVVYVDDLMVLAEPHAKVSFMERLKEEWTCSTPEEVDCKNWVPEHQRNTDDRLKSRNVKAKDRWKGSTRNHIVLKIINILKIIFRRMFFETVMIFWTLIKPEAKNSERKLGTSPVSVSP
eukprot:s2994_g9.t1